MESRRFSELPPEKKDIFSRLNERIYSCSVFADLMFFSPIH